MVMGRLIILFFILMTNALAKKHNPSSLLLIRKNIGKEERRKRELSFKISNLEKSLSRKNSSLLGQIKSRKESEKELFQLKKDVKEMSVVISTQIDKTKKVLAGLVLNSLSAEQRSAELLANKVLIKKFSLELLALQKNFGQNEKIKKNVNFLESRLQELYKIEGNLTSLVENLENQKKKLANQYLIHKKNESQMRKKLDEFKIGRMSKRLTKSSNIGLFLPPLMNYEKIEFGKKGVTFHFDDKQKIKAGRKGKVLHIGKLSNYGNVLFVDHGNKMTSVYLGQFSPNVIKGATVKKGGTLATTKIMKNKQNKLYFEVRKNNKVQQTIQLIEKALLAKSNKKTQNS
jgi:septal ring factor EnvC (AmiA/AmiB activator)